MKQGLWAAYSFFGDLPSARLSLCTQGEKRFTRAWHSFHSRFALCHRPSGSTWVADQSTLSYHMSHPMHEVDGVSHAAAARASARPAPATS